MFTFQCSQQTVFTAAIFGNKVNTGVTNDVTEGTVLFSYRAVINVITYTCAQLLFHVKMAAMKKLFIL